LIPPLVAQDVIDKLSLKPLLPEGGWFNQIWFKKDGVSAIYYLLQEGDFSEFHTLPYPEQYFFLMGDPVELFMEEKDKGCLKKVVLGQDLIGGETPSLRIEAHMIQGSRLKEGGKWALMSTVMSPPFEEEIYRTCPPKELFKAFPDQQELIKSLIN
jgi:uncharacterized protein